MKIVSVVGARPEFVQVAPLSRVLREAHHEVLVHTGQHYDDKMSKVFFEELGIPTPDYDLEIGSGSQGRQTGAMLGPLEDLLVKEAPDVILIRGDTNSTIAAAIAAAKLDLPIGHVEAGERSFVRSMPEEVNRVVADHVSSIFFCVSRRAVENLAKEGITHDVHRVGDVMHDALLQNLPIAKAKSDVIGRFGLTPKEYVLVTVHRADNTADARRLGGILEGLGRIGRPVIFPIHPRTAAAMKTFGLAAPTNVRLVEPFSYFDMLTAESGAAVVATDSGGVQREAYCLGVPCVTLRDETEWSETIDAGWNVLAGAEPQAIVRAIDAATTTTPPSRPDIFGGGDAAMKIRVALEAFVARRSK